MIAAALELFTFARTLSAKTWLIAIALIAMLTVATKLVTYGEHREAGRARTATITTDVAQLRVAQTDQATALERVTAARLATITTAIARTNAHPIAIDSLPPAIITLLDADDAQIRADSVYIVAADQLATTIPNVERAHATLDTILEHPGHPPDNSFALSPTRIIELTGMALIAHAAWTFLHQHAPSP